MLKNTNKFSLSLIKDIKILVNNIMTYYEKYDLKNAEYVSNVNMTTFKAMMYDKAEFDKSYNKEDMITYKIQVQEFCKLILKKNGIINSNYKPSHNNRIGRRYVVDFGCQRLQHKLRNFLLDTSYIDHDMINAHPTFLKYLIHSKLDKISPLLDSYCNDRETILNTYNLKKRDILIAINTDININKNQWIKQFHKELQPLKQSILQLNEYKFILSNNTKNPISSKINNIFCILENRLIVNVETKYKLKEAVLMYDGFMNNKQINIEDLNILSEEYNIKWKIKDRYTAIKIPIDYISKSEKLKIKQELQEKKKLEKQDERLKKQEERETEILEKQYNEDMEIGLRKEENRNYMAKLKLKFIEFNKTHHIIKSPLLYRRKSPYGWINYNITDFRLLYADKEKVEKDSFIDAWIKSGMATIYEKMDFFPYNKGEVDIPNDIFNTFEPFTYTVSKESLTPEDCRNGDRLYYLMNKLIYALSGNSNTCKMFLINSIAHLIQYPNILKETIIYLGGEEGVGKDILMTFIEKLLNNSKYYLSSSKPELLFGKFNDCLENKLIGHVSESKSTDSVKFIEDIKDLSTCNKLLLHKKGEKPYTVNNHIFLWFLSNNNNGITPSPSNRRIFAVWADSKYKENIKFFSEIVNLMENSNAVRVCFNNFNEMDLSNFKIRNFPKTNLLNQLELNNIKPLYRFLKELLYQDNNLIYKQDTNQIIIKTSDFKMRYLNYLTNHGNSKDHISTQKIKLDLLEFDIVTKVLDKSRLNHYLFNKKKVLELLEKKYFKNRENILETDIINDEDITFNESFIISDNSSDDGDDGN